jgi:ketosteroid isomerase-like protein
MSRHPPTRLTLLLLLCAALLPGCCELLLGDACPQRAAELARWEDARAAVSQTLDDLHAAAGSANGPAYFSHFADDAVFLGTDPCERWTLAAFRAYADPIFDEGQGWTYFPFERHVSLSADGTLAWFDERLDNAKYGESRGTGVLRLDDCCWKIVQYALSFPIPNQLAAEFTLRMRAIAEPCPPQE